MEEKTMVYVSSKTFQELCELKGRVSAFAKWVGRERYSISKEDCAAILGFELLKEDEAI